MHDAASHWAGEDRVRIPSIPRHPDGEAASSSVGKSVRIVGAD